MTESTYLATTYIFMKIGGKTKYLYHRVTLLYVVDNPKPGCRWSLREAFFVADIVLV